jgi:predicted regulator of Ras-like GTPase activity (Roadblock/LC7/MglB family)
MSNAAMSGNTGRVWGSTSTGADYGRTGSTRSSQARETGGLGWLLDDMVDRISQVKHALILSSDGLVTGTSRDLEGPDAEHLAAVSSGFHSLAKGAGRHFGAGEVRQTMIEFEDGFLFVTAAGDGSCLSILTGEGTDVGQIAYEMTLLVHRVGEHLGVAPRHDDGASTGT